MTNQPRPIQIFISSPGDVSAERAIARTVIEELNKDPLLRRRAFFQPIAWDDPLANAPMLATLTPQEAINQQLPLPSECHIVVVILWSRIGTPLPPDYKKPNGEPYLSGTEWEYLDAVNTARTHPQGLPRVAIYRRTEKFTFDPDDPKAAEKWEQYNHVKDFFAQFVNPDGSLRGGYNEYKNADDFRDRFTNVLKTLVDDILETSAAPAPRAVVTPQSTLPAEPLWHGSPFPGLRAFTVKDEPIFNGRGRETAMLVRKVEQSRFVAVVGASGSGKSSLVGAGLLPKLEANSIQGSKDWLVLRFTPGEVGDDPFMPLAVRIQEHIGGVTRDIAAMLKDDPTAFIDIRDRLLTGRPEWAELLLFADQFEELFTIVQDRLREPFIKFIIQLMNIEKVRIVATLRADFYHRAVEWPALSRLFEEGTFPVSIPDQFALREMIEKPANRAALVFDEGLAERIVRDTLGDHNEPGALALMAYTLDELYQQHRATGKLTFAQYEALGGVQGAIGKRSELVFARMLPDVQAALPRVFRDLVEVDDRGTATRQRAPFAKVAADDAARRLVDELTNARLLVVNAELGEDGDQTEMVEVAHEALLRSWTRLANWIENTQDDLRLLRQVRIAAREWDASGRRADYLWSQERLDPVYKMKERLNVEFEPLVQGFVRPEIDRLLEEFKNFFTRDHRRQLIIERMAEIGQNALPAIIEAKLSNRGFDSADRAIYRVLRQHYDEALPVLIEATKHQSASRRSAAIDALGAIGGEEEIPLLINALQDRKGEVRSAAIEALFLLADVDVTHHLLPLLQDKDDYVRARALNTLGRGQKIDELVPLVMNLVSDKRYRISSAAVYTIGQWRAVEVLPDLINLLQSMDSPKWYDVVRLVANFGGASAVSALLERLRLTSDYEQQTYLVSGISNIRDPEAVPILIDLLRENQGDPIRVAAARALSRLASAEQIDDVINALNDDLPAVRNAMLQTMLRIGIGQSPEPVIKLLHDSDNDVRVMATRLLGHYRITEAADLLIVMLNDEEIYNRHVAAEALVRLKDNRIVEWLLSMLQNEDNDVRSISVELLGLLSQPDTVPPLIALLDEDVAELQGKIVETLAAIGDERAVEPILNRMRSSDAGFVVNGSVALWQLGRIDLIHEFSNILINAYYLDDDDNQRDALFVLGKLGKLELAPFIAYQLDNYNSSVHLVSALALAELGDTQSIPMILRLAGLLLWRHRDGYDSLSWR